MPAEDVQTAALPDLTAMTVADLLALRARVAKYSPDQPRDEHGEFTSGGSGLSTAISDYTSRHAGPGGQSREEIRSHLSGLLGHEPTAEQVDQMHALIGGALPSIGAGIAGADERLGTAAIRQLDALQQQFPGTRIELLDMRSPDHFQNGQTDIALTSPSKDGADIYLNSRFWGAGARESRVIGDSSGGFHPPGTEDAEGVVTHEFGHAVLHGLRTQREGSPGYRTFMDWQMAANAEYYSRGVHGPASLRSISGYGRTGGFEEAFCELFAAAYAPHSTSDHPAIGSFRDMLAAVGVDKGKP